MSVARFERNGKIAPQELEQLLREQAERRKVLTEATKELISDLNESARALAAESNR